MRLPRPFCRPPKYSATIAAITAAGAATRRPVMMYGTAPGSRTNRANWPGVAASAVISSACTGCTWRSPRTVETNTGTSTTMVTTSRRGISVVEPNMVVNTGASATIGTALAASTTGVLSSDTSRDRAASSASATPSRNPATSPTSAFAPVTSDVETRIGSCAPIWAAIAVGAGSRNAGTPADHDAPRCQTTQHRAPRTDRRPASGSDATRS